MNEHGAGEHGYRRVLWDAPLHITLQPIQKELSMQKTYIERLHPEADDSYRLTRVIYAAFRQCYSKDTADNLMYPDNKTMPDIEKFIRSCIEKGHLSPLEHVSVSYVIKGISRVSTHQLVRHRIASYSQQSQRYNRFSFTEDSDEGLEMDDFMVVPESVLPYVKDNEMAQYTVASMFAFYEHLIESCNVPAEDARFFLPEGVRSNIVVTMNLRSWIHFCHERLCKSAQWEIRNVAKLIGEDLIKTFPWLKGIIGPKCVQSDVCENGGGKLCEEHYAWRFENE